MRLLFAGTPVPAVASLRAILGSRHEVVAVLTRPDAAVGRGRRVVASPVAELAREAGIETLTPRTPKDPDFLSRLSELDVDCAPVVAYGGLIPAHALQVPRHGWVNLHFSLLPAWRGAAPVQHAVLAGDQITLTGNIQAREIQNAQPDEIEARVREIIALAGPRRLVISTTGTPLEPISPQVEANYHRLIDATLKHGVDQG